MSHRDILVAAFDAELLVWAWFTTNTGATMATGQQLAAAQIAGQPSAWCPTGQVTLPLHGIAAKHPNSMES